MHQLKLLLAVLAANCCNFGYATATRVFCYYGTWSNYRVGQGKFTPSHTDVNLCTHIGYSFFGIKNNLVVSLDEYLDFEEEYGLGNIAKVMKLKEKKPDLKVICVIGGWTQGSRRYSEMAANPNNRKKFINSAIEFVEKYGFDGIDLDWEYPGQREGSIAADKANFVELLKELSQELRKKNKELSIAVGASKATADQSYDIQHICNIVDLIHLMTYDFHKGYYIVSNHAPLDGNNGVNVKSAVDHWSQMGCPFSKLVIGIGTYGRTFTLAPNAVAEIGAAAAGPGHPGPFTKESGMLGYNELCQLPAFLNSKWSEEGSVPWLSEKNLVVVYDDPKSVAEKVAYGESKNLGGYMIWSIETDDFLGNCGKPYPILHAIWAALGEFKPETPMLEKMPKIPPTRTATNDRNDIPKHPKPTVNEGGKVCSEDGFFPNESDRNKFYRCVNGVRYDGKCPDKLVWNAEINTCDFP